ncbi:hypothetical protein ARALYDRAFT_490246 [Arabidopsis lyrata subsp. lyrata]|uniref:Uncharacterized protein n=1 Tax=Arabidopsis lyrata subsp. lyrata TaxID=81972 RepID=D7M396_ARALL|nr:hypothetical protein ARALYDRAFT_490246 [Arabidopsis lyrata subsp. lyrata]
MRHQNGGGLVQITTHQIPLLGLTLLSLFHPLAITKALSQQPENKPKLIAMVEDLYRSHRSLAQKHDLLIKTSSLNSDSTAITHQPATSSGRNCVKKQSLMVKLKTMKEELERLREENRVYKKMMGEKKQGLLLCSFCFQFNCEIFSYHLLRLCLLFLMILCEVGCFKYE